METRNEIRPFLPQHPGRILKAELKARGIRQNVFATMIGMQPSHLNALLQGTRNISPQLAARLESALQIPAKVWLNLQNNYNLDMLRTADLVDGYTPKTEPVYALAEPGKAEQELWDVAFRAGQKDILGRLMPILKEMGLTEEQIQEASRLLLRPESLSL